MTTDPILEAIDGELERLRTIRVILLPLLEFGNVSAVPSTTPTRRTRKPHREISPSVSVMAEPPTSRLVEPAPAISSETSVSDAVMQEMTRLPARQPPVRRTRKARSAVSSGALAGAIPSAPVVVRPAALVPIKLPAITLPQVEPYSFAAMVRAAEQEMSPLS